MKKQILADLLSEPFAYDLNRVPQPSTEPIETNAQGWAQAQLGYKERDGLGKCYIEMYVYVIDKRDHTNIKYYHYVDGNISIEIDPTTFYWQDNHNAIKKTETNIEIIAIRFI